MAVRTLISSNDTLSITMPFKSGQGFNRTRLQTGLSRMFTNNTERFNHHATSHYHYQIIRITTTGNIIRIYGSYYPIRSIYHPEVQGTREMPHADPYDYDAIPTLSKTTLLKSFKESFRRLGGIDVAKNEFHIRILMSQVKIDLHRRGTDEAEDFIDYMQGISGFHV